MKLTSAFLKSLCIRYKLSNKDSGFDSPDCLLQVEQYWQTADWFENSGNIRQNLPWKNKNESIN